MESLHRGLGEDFNLAQYPQSGEQIRQNHQGDIPKKRTNVDGKYRTVRQTK